MNSRGYDKQISQLVQPRAATALNSGKLNTNHAIQCCAGKSWGPAIHLDIILTHANHHENIVENLAHSTPHGYDKSFDLASQLPRSHCDQAFMRQARTIRNKPSLWRP